MLPLDREICLDAAGDDARQKQLAPDFTGIDTHTHVFKSGLGLIEGRRYTPAYDASIADYLTMLDDNGMSHGVLVQISILGTDNSYLLEALRQEPTRLRGIVVVDPGIGFEQLRAFDDLGVVGVRLNLIGLPDPNLGSAEWQAHLRRLADLDWQVEVQAEARRLPRLVPPLIAAGVRVVIDHFGRPDKALGIDDPGFRYLLTLGKTGKVWVKMSGEYRNGPAEQGEQIALSAAAILLHEIGAERLLWGSDWPHTCFEQPGMTAAMVRALERWIPSDTDRKTVLIDTPRDLFRFSRPWSMQS